MDNHLHLLVETPEANLGSGMQRLHSLYAQIHNERHGRCGHLFQDRFGSVRVLSDEQLWAVVAYVVKNPVKAGLCERPEQWRWSSHAATIGHAPCGPLDTGRLMSFLGAAGGNPYRRYAELTCEPA